jgi:hypothetical protein
MLWLTVFSIAMGFLETAVVVYLRKIYYPHGFNFPLTPVGHDVAATEFFREAATIVMLVGIGVIAGKNTSQRFAFFIYCFAVWDIFYYVFLDVILGWPQSLFTWDILFLIPVPWVGPVLAPCLVSITMIVLTLSVIYFQEKGFHAHINAREWILLIAGSLIIIFSFTFDYFRYISSQNLTSHIWTLTGDGNMFDEIVHYVPQSYNWWLFMAGEVITIAGILFFVKRIIKLKPQ